MVSRPRWRRGYWAASVPGLGDPASRCAAWCCWQSGVVATNVIGRRVLARAESWLMMIPVFRTIYAPVKQLVVAFSPDNEYGFKRVVMVEDPRRGWVMGFLTKEFTVDRGAGREAMMAVYVPTNHLYLGDIVVYPRERAFFPDLTVEEGIRIFLTGGMSLPGEIRQASRSRAVAATTSDASEANDEDDERSNESDARVVQGVSAGAWRWSRCCWRSCAGGCWPQQPEAAAPAAQAGRAAAGRRGQPRAARPGSGRRRRLQRPDAADGRPRRVGRSASCSAWSS